MQQRHRRRFRIIRPRLQLRLIGSFFGIAALALLLQYQAFLWLLSNAAIDYPEQGAQLVARMTTQLGLVLAVSFGLLLPVTLLVGVLVTHRIAGPVYRLETYLRQVQDGQARGDCHLRQGDELQELCTLVNEVTRAQRSQAADTAASADAKPAQLRPVA